VRLWCCRFGALFVADAPDWGISGSRPARVGRRR